MFSQRGEILKLAGRFGNNLQNRYHYSGEGKLLSLLILKKRNYATNTEGQEVIGGSWPGALPEQKFIAITKKQLSPLGFNSDNTIPCVSLCRDELTSPLFDIIDRTWRTSEVVSNSNTFLMSSLSAMLFLGDTGIHAATDHAPRDENGIERFVFYAFPHIGYNEKGEVGKLKRFGIPQDSACCGALIGFQKELKHGFLKVETNLHDIEQSLLKQRLLKNIDLNEGVPSLVALTNIAYQTILADLEGLIDRNLKTNPRYAEYAIFTGVQIHAPTGNFLWPGEAYAVTHKKNEDGTVNMSEMDKTPLKIHLS